MRRSWTILAAALLVAICLAESAAGASATGPSGEGRTAAQTPQRDAGQRVAGTSASEVSQASNTQSSEHRATSPASPEPGGANTPEGVTEARRRWDEGLQAASEGNFELAVAAFRQSYSLVPHVETLRNLGLAELEVGDFVQAAQHLSKYLAVKSDLSEENREELESELTNAERMVGRLDLDVTPSDAVLQIDGVRVEPPLTGRAWYVEPGRHRILARMPGAQPIEQEVELGAGQQKPVAIALIVSRPTEEELAAAKERPAAGDQRAERWPELKRWVVVGGGALTVLSLGLGFYGEAALSTASADVRTAQADAWEAAGVRDARYPCQSPSGAALDACRDLRDATEDERRAAWIANVGWIGAGVFGAATVAAWLFWPDEDAATASVSVRLLPWVAEHGSGCVLGGRF